MATRAQTLAAAAGLAVVAAGSAVVATSSSPAPAHHRTVNRSYLQLKSLTPGALNPDVTQANVATTICKGGWTKTIRPKNLDAQEKASLTQYGYADQRPSSYEYDHLISLELGGAASDPANLWPEPDVAKGPDGLAAGRREKDALENFLNAQICGRRKPRITLAVAQQEIRGNWYATYTQLGRPADPYHHARSTPSPSVRP